MKCQVNTCIRNTSKNRKFCSAHYARLSRYGDLRESIPIGGVYHGYAKKNKRSPTYNSWRGMIHRCTNPKAAKYKYYGGKGITVCERWRKFKNFLEDMGPIPFPKQTIGRKNANKNYNKSNCQWETWQEQYASRQVVK